MPPTPAVVSTKAAFFSCEISLRAMAGFIPELAATNCGDEIARDLLLAKIRDAKHDVNRE